MSLFGKLEFGFELTIDNGGIRFADDLKWCFAAPLVPPLQGAGRPQGGLGVVASLQLYRQIGKITCRYNPQSASLTAP